MAQLGDVQGETLAHKLSFATTLLAGQPGFFTPRWVNPYFAAPGVAATSFYDTTPLYKTLAATIDFNRVTEPGFDVDLFITTDVRTMTKVWNGDLSLADKIADGSIDLHGPSELRAQFSSWLRLGMFAHVEPAESR